MSRSHDPGPGPLPMTPLGAIAARADASAASAADSRRRGRRHHRNGPPEEVMFPVTPMLDMAFQLLAFFVLTFQAPSAETHLDLDLPVTPAALPTGPQGEAQPTPVPKVDSDLENDLWVRVEGDDLGDLKALRLGESTLPDVATLGNRLRRYAETLDGRSLRVRIVADDTLRYEVAAQVIAACSSAGVSSVRLTTPSAPGGKP